MDCPSTQLPADLYGFTLVTIDKYSWCYVFRDSSDNLYCTIRVYAVVRDGMIVYFNVITVDRKNYETEGRHNISPSSLPMVVKNAGNEVLQDLRNQHANAKAVQSMLETLENWINREEPAPTFWERLG